MVHVGATDAPVTVDECEDVMDEMADNGMSGCDLLGWEWEMGLHDTIEEHARRRGIDLRFVRFRARSWSAGRRCDACASSSSRSRLRYSTPRPRGRVVLKTSLIPSDELIPDAVREGDQAVVRPDRLLVGRLRLSRRDLPQPLAGLSDEGRASAGHRTDWHEYEAPGATRSSSKRSTSLATTRRNLPRFASSERSPGACALPLAIRSTSPSAVSPAKERTSSTAFAPMWTLGARTVIQNASSTTKRLLGFWFGDEHRASTVSRSGSTSASGRPSRRSSTSPRSRGSNRSSTSSATRRKA